MRAILLGALLCAAASGQVCGANDLSGGYGFQLAARRQSPARRLPWPLSDGWSSRRKAASVELLRSTSTGCSSEIRYRHLHLPNQLRDRLRITGRFRRMAALSGRTQPGGCAEQFHQTDLGTGGRGRTAKAPRLLQRWPSSMEITRCAWTRQRTVTMADGNGRLSWVVGRCFEHRQAMKWIPTFVRVEFRRRIARHPRGRRQDAAGGADRSRKGRGGHVHRAITLIRRSAIDLPPEACFGSGARAGRHALAEIAVRQKLANRAGEGFPIRPISASPPSSRSSPAQPTGVVTHGLSRTPAPPAP